MVPVVPALLFDRRWGRFIVNHFIILTLGKSGSSLLHSLINQHSLTEVWCENSHFKDWEPAQRKAEEAGKIWGNKALTTQFRKHSKPEDIDRWLGDLKIIDNRRSLNGFLQCCEKVDSNFSKSYYVDMWHSSNEFVDKVTEGAIVHPVQFEELLTDPTNIAEGICEFLEIPFEPEIVTNAPLNCGNVLYQQPGYDLRDVIY